MRKVFAFSALFLLASCRPPLLEVDLVYVGARSLASFWVCTPDPQLCNPPTGQKLVLLWRLPECKWSELKAPCLHLKVRFRNREEKELWWDITERSGSVVYSHVFSPPAPEQDIRTYRAEIVDQGKVIHVVEQMLWTPWIQLNPQENLGEPCVPSTNTEMVDPSLEAGIQENKADVGDYVWEDLEAIE